MVPGLFRPSVALALLFAICLAACDPIADGGSPQDGLGYAQPPRTDVASPGPTVQVVINHAPLVTAMDSSAGLVTTGTCVGLQASVGDPDGDALALRWQSTCPGSFDRDDTTSVTFLAGVLPADVETCTFEIAVDDDHGGTATGKLTLSTVPPTIQVAPLIRSVAQSDESTAAGQPVRLQATAAGGPLTWTWRASAGVLSGQADSAEASSVIWHAPAEPSTCTITVTASNLDGTSADHPFTVRVSQDLPSG